MKKSLSLREVAVYWDKVTMNDRILALNSVSIIGPSARGIAQLEWIDVPDDVKLNLKGLH